MKNISVRFALLYVIFIFTISCSAQEILWPESTRESKPWTRWWWMGNAVDRENLTRELKEMKDAGIGGVEITPIYGVKGEEKKFIEYLSPEFSEMLKFTIAEAAKNGMGVDLPPGSGWRCGGPFVPEEKGLWSLKIHKFPVLKGQVWQLPKTIKNAAAVSVKNGEGKTTVITSTGNYDANENGTVYVAERVKNRDMVKQTSIGGEK